jgi:hypothetical protein
MTPERIPVSKVVVWGVLRYAVVLAMMVVWWWGPWP